MKISPLGPEKNAIYHAILGPHQESPSPQRPDWPASFLVGCLLGAIALLVISTVWF